ncbi:MAG: sigma-54-dependent Fis family transcriptional regulator [Candidatus Aureabacteria bacterium]|nr:sigma-54-dependent Fis family transcriptional regulator [Candidatus Auribacterota bacterium]
MKILIADDEQGIRLTLKDSLEEAGFSVSAVANGNEAVNMLREQKFECVISDIRMPGMDGISLLKYIKSERPGTEVILITAFGDVEQAVQAMKSGANDYIVKPFMNEEVILKVKKIEQLHELKVENLKLKQQISEDTGFGNLVGRSPEMKEIFNLIETVSPTDSSVLLCGESGTGKELVANLIHAKSLRKGKTLVKLSCAVFPETLLEDELFGHEKGAYTDAKAKKIGRFEQADGGTIFLDDIDDMSPKIQVKLLRVLQERCFERLGGTETVHVDIRIIAATKKDLGKLVKEGFFREDLYYRLNVIPIGIPSLRDHMQDIKLLAEHFIRMYGKDADYSIAPRTLERMMSYGWPGNVRELENAIERAIALAGESKELKEEHLFLPQKKDALYGSGDSLKLRDYVEKLSARYIAEVLKKTGGKKSLAAKVLGISRKSLWEKMKEYNIENEKKPLM